MKKKLLLLSLSSLMALPVVGCSKEEEKEKGWNINGSDYQNILKFENKVSQTNGKFEFTIDNDFGPFKGKINEDDVILFSINNLKEIKGKKYYTYEDFKNCEIKKETFVSSDIGRGFTITFDGNPNERYGTLTNKSATIDNLYAFSAMNESLNATRTFKQEDGEWEDAYIESAAEYTDPTIGLNIEMYIANIILGGMTENPVSVANGIYGLLGTFFNAVKPAEPSIQDVLDKLDDMDKKLDEINAEIQKNQKELINEHVYEQAQIDKVLATLYQQDITAFVTDYIDPIDTIERKYSQYVETKLKEVVKAEPQKVGLHYKRNTRGKLILISQCEADYDDSFTKIFIGKNFGWTNAKKYLEDHNDIVGEGFMDELQKDIANTVHKNYVSNIYPQDELTEEQYRKDYLSAILDEFEKQKHSGEYGSEAYNDASNMLDKCILLMKRISGVATGESILNSIINRVKYIYNFASETKAKVRKIIANIKLQMERFVDMTSIACRYAKINTKEMADQYKIAIETIQSYQKTNKSLPDNYSYILSNKVDSAFVWSKYNTQFRNRGESPEFKKEFLTEKIDSFNRFEGTMSRTKFDIKKTPIVDNAQSAKILTRYKMLLNAGLESETNYLEYLTKYKGIDSKAYEIQKVMIKDGWISDDTSRIITEYEGIKDLTVADNVVLTCIENGNSEGGNYFKIGNKYKYKCDYEDECWSGEKACGRFINAHTGAEETSHLISAYAKYSEKEWYWMDNEHWAFTNTPYGSFFYIMYQAI